MYQRFFRLQDNVYFPSRWHLWQPFDAKNKELGGWEFTMARPFDKLDQPVTLSVQVPGTPLDYTQADHGMPIVTSALADVISELVGTAIQRFAARIEGIDQPYEIVNVLHALSCADESRSEIMYWTEADKRPDKVGKYRMVTKLVLDASRIGDAHLFRLAEYDVILICSATLKSWLERGRFTGLRFEEIAV
jgi:hypothetical protein